MKRRSFRVEVDGPLVSAVAAGLRSAEADARTLVDRGAVYVQGRRARSAEAPVKAGQVVMVVQEEAGRSALQAVTSGPALEVLYEDDALLAVNKPAGITAQPTPGRTGESLLDLASKHLGKEAGLVHRLDRQTSGVTLFGKTREATSSLAAQFREGKVRKRYLAVATGTLPPSGEIDWPLSRDPSRVGRWRASRTANGLSAFTRFERLREGDGFALVALYPETGRTHQLRAHLRALGAPIAGDALYGGPERIGELPARRCLLHAQQIAFLHPVSGAELKLEAPLPADMAVFFERT